MKNKIYHTVVTVLSFSSHGSCELRIINCNFTYNQKIKITNLLKTNLQYNIVSH